MLFTIYPAEIEKAEQNIIIQIFKSTTTSDKTFIFREEIYRRYKLSNYDENDIITANN